jgi:AcrR family transcriptional regulator
MAQIQSQTQPQAQSAPETTRVPLSRERVLQAAITLADESGLDSLSMRRLAQELGVEAMSLYHYFKSKNELLAGMLEAVYAEFERPPRGGDWREAIRTASVSAHHTLLRHPWACGLIGQPMAPSSVQFEWMDSILGRLRSAGFSAEMTHHAYHALDSHIVGFTLWVLPYLAIQREMPDLAEQALAQIAHSNLPHLTEHIEFHQADRPGDTSEFDFGLDLLLDSLERLRHTA